VGTCACAAKVVSKKGSKRLRIDVLLNYLFVMLSLRSILSR
jgi:hypothetical protein